jgi:transcriptional regulator with XRE-family HTH domain
VKTRIKQLRINKGLTQSDMGKILGITQRAFAFYETGDREPDLDILVKLADYFDVSVDYILFRVNDPKLAIIPAADLPQELRTIEGINAVIALKEALKTGLSADEINEILSFATRIRSK